MEPNHFSSSPNFYCNPAFSNTIPSVDMGIEVSCVFWSFSDTCRFWQIYTQIPQRRLPILVYELTLVRFIKSIIIQPFQKTLHNKSNKNTAFQAYLYFYCMAGKIDIKKPHIASCPSVW